MASAQKAETTYYELLGVATGASADEIHAAFARLIRQHRERPRDRNAERTNKARQINLAFATLGDARKRRAYDEALGIAPKPPATERTIFTGLSAGASAAVPTHEANVAKVARASDAPDALRPDLDREPQFLLQEQGQELVVHSPDEPIEAGAPPEPPEAYTSSLVSPADDADDDELPAARDWDRPRRKWIPAALLLLVVVLPTGWVLSDRIQRSGPFIGDERAETTSEKLVQQSSSIAKAFMPSGSDDDAQADSNGDAKVLAVNARPADVSPSTEQSTVAGEDEAKGPDAAPGEPEEATASTTAPSPVSSAGGGDVAAEPSPPADAPVEPRVRASLAAPSRWVSGSLLDSDNPRGRFVGAVAVRFRVQTDGRVSACRPIRSSGNAMLDATTCRLVEQRLRFSPAKDADGQPVESQVTTTYTWGRHLRN